MELAPFDIRVVHLRAGDIDTNLGKATTRVSGWNSAYRDASNTAWSHVQHHMRTGPKPETIAQGIWRVMQWGSPPPVVDLGGFFQTVLAPLGKRLLPSRLMQTLNRQYYGL